MPTATLPKVLFLNHPTSADPAYVKHIEAQVELTVRPCALLVPSPSPEAPLG